MFSDFNVKFPFNSGGQSPQYSPPHDQEKEGQRRPTFDYPDHIDTDEIPFLDHSQPINFYDNNPSDISDPTEKLLSQLKDTKRIQEIIAYLNNLLDTLKKTSSSQKKPEIHQLFITACKKPCAYPVQVILLKAISTLSQQAPKDALTCIYYLIYSNNTIIHTLEKKLLFEEAAPYIHIINTLVVLAKELSDYKNISYWLSFSKLLLRAELKNKSTILIESDLLFIHALNLPFKNTPSDSKEKYLKLLKKVIDTYSFPEKNISWIKKLLLFILRKQPETSTKSLLEKDLLLLQGEHS